MKIIGKVLIKSWIIMFALTRTLPEMIDQSIYENSLDYIIDNIYLFLGNYDISHMMILCLIGLLLFKLKQETIHYKNYKVCAMIFAFILVIGESIYREGNFLLLVGSVVNIAIATIKLIGYYMTFHILLNAIEPLLKHTNVDSIPEKEISKWIKLSFITLTIFYMFILVLNFPGNLCWDVIGQIEQVIGNTEYSTHHPIFHTIIVGGVVEFGHRMFHSYEIGLFVYMIIQILFFVTSLTFSMYYLLKKHLDRRIFYVILGLYLFVPIYSNLATTAIKDIPFISSFLIYFIYLYDYYSDLKQRILQKHFLFLSIFGILTCLFRNNGLYMIVLMYIIYFMLFILKKDKKELIHIAKLGFVLLATFFIIQTVLVSTLQATKGSSREIFSLPFQITARYLQLYHEELPMEEEIIIESILGNVDQVRAAYNPDIADPVKNLYLDDSVELHDLVNYAKLFLVQFCKHPITYIEGFLIHINGWFNPSISNSIRYEVEYETIYTGGIVNGTSKLVLFIYRFLARITPIALLETPGFYTWILLYITAYKIHKRQQLIIILPQWIAVLICMISPCFLLHPRYALPIMFTIPFIIGCTCIEDQKEVSQEGKCEN